MNRADLPELLAYWRSKPAHSNERAGADIIDELQLELRKAESQRDSFRSQLTAEREGRMLGERIVDEVRARNRELERLTRWRRVDDERPPAFTTILVWITGGPMHCGEDYPDFGIFNASTGKFQANVGDDDAEVPVSHWMPEPAAPANST